MKSFLFALFTVLVSGGIRSEDQMLLHWQVVDSEYEAPYAIILVHPGDENGPIPLVQIETYWTGTHYVYSEGTSAIVNSGGDTGSTVFADLTSAGITPENAAQYSFFVELGNWVDGKWTAVAQSEYVSYQTIGTSVRVENLVHGFQEDYYRGWKDIPTFSGWELHAVVPEPDSRIVLLLGAGILLLRRKSLLP